MSQKERTVNQIMALLPARICPECKSTNLKTIKGKDGIVWWNCNKCDALMAIGSWQ